MRAFLLSTTALSLLMLCALAPAAKADTPTGQTTVISNGDLDGVSADGAYGLGVSGTLPAIWSSSGERTLLPLGSYTSGNVVGMASNGAIVGTLNNKAVYWSSSSSTPVSMSSGLGVANSIAHAISANGAYAVATYFGGGLPWNQGFVYNTTSHVATLLMVQANAANAFGVSNDGTIVAGEDFNDGLGFANAVYWYNGGGGTTYIEHDLSVVESSATAVSADHSVIIGNIGHDGVRWVQTSAGVYSGAINLEALPGAHRTEALAVSSDGSVIVGRVLDGGYSYYAFRWASANMVTIEDWLTANGVTVDLDGAHTSTAFGVSGDGSVVVGTMNDGSSYIARVGGTGAGLITLDDLTDSLHGQAIAPQAATFSSDLAMHGAHGHPLMQLAPEAGKMTAWVNGDFGFRAGSDQSAYNHVADVGVGYRATQAAQFNFSVGKMFAGEKTAQNGKIEQDMTYVLPEVVAHLPSTPIWATVSLQYAGGDADMERGYLNAGNQDYSKGTASVDVLGTRARLDWADAFAYEKASFTPYVDHQHTVSWIGAYTEMGGGFPARWDARSEGDDVTRLGIDGKHPLDDKTTLYATIEQNRWWQGRGTEASGTVLGLSDFTLPGQKGASDWTRFALGVSHDVGAGRLTGFANAKTTGQTPQYWLALGYQYNF